MEIRFVDRPTEIEDLLLCPWGDGDTYTRLPNHSES